MESESLELVEEKGSVWDDLPTDMACEILERMTNFRDIFNYMNTSKRFVELAKRCVTQMDSEENIQVDIRVLAGFSRLNSLSNNITLILHGDSIGLISTIPQLRYANFYLEGASLNDYLPQILQQLTHLEGGIRIWDDKLLFILQELRYTLLGDMEYVSELAAKIQSIHPEFQFYDLRPEFADIERAGYRPLLIDKEMRLFLNEGDFGLVHSKLPPSPNNPSFSIYLKYLAYSGIATYSQIIGALLLYARYHRLIKEQIIIPDQLMKKHFNMAINRINAERILIGEAPFALDALTINELKFIIIQSTIGRKIKNPADYDLPNPITPQDRETIDIVLSMSRNEYISHHNGFPETFYRTDGSTFTL